MKRVFALVMVMIALAAFAAPALADTNVVNELNKYGNTLSPAKLTNQADPNLCVELHGTSLAFSGGVNAFTSMLSTNYFTLSNVTADSFQINNSLITVVMHVQKGKIVQVDVTENITGGEYTGTYGSMLPPTGDNVNLPFLSALFLFAATGLILLRRKRA